MKPYSQYAYKTGVRYPEYSTVYTKHTISEYDVTYFRKHRDTTDLPIISNNSYRQRTIQNYRASTCELYTALWRKYTKSNLLVFRQQKIIDLIDSFIFKDILYSC